jgi:(+)-abscisic acid 8'-hydroxylase
VIRPRSPVRACMQATPPRPGTFLPFGSGVHACPGNELAKLEMLVLVHRLVTAYRYVLGRSEPDPPVPPILSVVSTCFHCSRRRKLILWVAARRWEVVGPSDEVSYSPFPVPRHGLKARLWSEAAASAVA